MQKNMYGKENEMTQKTNRIFPEKSTDYMIRTEGSVFLVEKKRRGHFADGDEAGSKKSDDSR